MVTNRMFPHISCYPIAIGTCEVHFFYSSSTLTWIKPLQNTDISISMVILGMAYYSFTNIGTINPTYQTSPSQSSGFDLASVTWQHGAPKTSHSKCSQNCMANQQNWTGQWWSWLQLRDGPVASGGQVRGGRSYCQPHCLLLSGGVMGSPQTQTRGRLRRSEDGSGAAPPERFCLSSKHGNWVSNYDMYKF